MKKLFKGLLITTLVLALLMTTALGDAITKTIDVVYNSVNLTVNRKKIEADNILYNGTTYVPLRAVADALGKDVGWDGNTNTASINDKGATQPAIENPSANIYTHKDENGNALYTVEIKSIRLMSERNKYSEKNPAEVYIIDYTYKNINNSTELYIGDSSFKVIDSQGKVGYTYPNSVTSYPQSTPKGASCDAQIIFGVDNISSEVSLLYYNNMFRDSDASFRLKTK